MKPPKVKALRHRIQSTLFKVGDEFQDVPESAVLSSRSDDGESVADVQEIEEFVEGLAELGSLASETILGYVWWSLFYALAPLIWFFPLNELDITGYEVLIALLLSPALLGLSPLRRFVFTNRGLAVLQILSVLSLASYQSSTLIRRLTILSLGNAASNLALCASWHSTSPKQRFQGLWGFLLGHFLLLAIRVWWTSLNAVWASDTFNTIVIVLGLLAVVERLYSSESPEKGKQQKMSRQLEEISSPTWSLAAIGFGSMLFLTHWLFSEASLLSRWVVTGLPNSGPPPNPWGGAVIVALAFSLSLLSPTILFRSKLWWIIGLGGGLLLYYANTYIAFMGGLIIGLYVFSLWPYVIQSVMGLPPARTMTLAMLVYIVWILAAVWVVAYNFVPVGGTIAREQTGIVMGLVMMGVAGLALFIGRSKARGGKEPLKRTESRGASDRRFFAYGTRPALLLLVLVALTGLAVRYERFSYVKPEKEEQREFTAMIWTIHFCYDNQGWPSFERAAQLINNTGADVVGLLETDASRPFLHSHDLTMWLEERLGMYADFGPATRKHTWGAVLLSKHPIIKSEHHLLPSPEGELAPAISATLNISGHLTDFVVVHMGNDVDDLDRKLQAEALSTILSNFENPAVFLGYVTSAPFSRDYHQLVRVGKVKDIDNTDRNRWCQYIFYKKLIRLGYARISHGGLSDTETQLAKFRIPESPDEKDNDKISINPSDVPQRIRFPETFGSYSEFAQRSWGSHRYQDKTPKYFLP
ncbi:PGAP2-interacting protein-like [Oscarella lobularis]|uniref:PGAP2-interacting protein-like n=1 Tax=Oscarella lobularis TaxID=121494 RepID=UPI003314130B